MNLFNDLLAIPFEQLKFILTKVAPSDEGFHLLFVLTAYPGLYLLIMNFSIPNLFFVPILGLVYLIDSKLFWD